jgi:hypothetical protein
MKAQQPELLNPSVSLKFEIVPVLTSADFWAKTQLDSST